MYLRTRKICFIKSFFWPPGTFMLEPSAEDLWLCIIPVHLGTVWLNPKIIWNARRRERWGLSAAFVAAAWWGFGILFFVVSRHDWHQVRILKFHFCNSICFLLISTTILNHVIFGTDWHCFRFVLSSNFSFCYSSPSFTLRTRLLSSERFQNSREHNASKEQKWSRDSRGWSVG